MNILIMCKIFAKSGVGSHIMDLSTELSARGHKVWIMSSTNEHVEYLQEKGIPFLNCDFSIKPIRIFSNIRKIKQFMVYNNIDIVHCHHRTCSMYMQILSRVTGIPFVWSNHLDDIPHDFIHRKLTFYGKQAICVSTELKKFCIDKLRIPENKVSVVLNGVKPENYSYDADYVKRIKEKYHIGDKKVIGLFARLAPIKGHIHLINAVSMLPSELISRFIVIIFGGGGESEYLSELKLAINEKGLENSFVFEGFVSPSEALSISDVTVLPSLKEGFPIVTIESYLMKKLHIRSKTAGFTDMGQFCLGYEIADDKTLSNYLYTYLAGNDYKEIVERAYKFALNNCTVSTMTNKILDIYRDAIVNE